MNAGLRWHIDFSLPDSWYYLKVMRSRLSAGGRMLDWAALHEYDWMLAVPADRRRR